MTDEAQDQEQDQPAEQELGTAVQVARRGSEVQGAQAPVPVSLIQHEPVSMHQFLSGLASEEALEEQTALMAAYDRAVDALVGPNDVITKGDRSYKRKSAWRKLGRYFHISTQLVSKDGHWVLVDGVKHYVAEVVMRAVAPWGQYAEALAYCSTEESKFMLTYPACPRCGGRMWDNRNPPDDAPDWKKNLPDFTCRDKSCGGTLAEGDLDPELFGTMVPDPTAFAKARHDCGATAQTRASNRAISDLIAAGEVSAEEIGEGRAWSDGEASGSGRRKLPTLDDRIGWGEHEDKTYRELARVAPDYAWWLVKEARKPPKAIKDALRVELGKLAEGRAQDSHGAGSQDPQDAPGTGDPLLGKPGSGKHGRLTWREILDRELDYLQSMMPRPFIQERAPEGSLLRLLLEAGVEVGGPPTWFDAFNQLLSSHGISEEDARNYAWVNPDVPSDFSDWTEDTAQHEVRRLMHHGVEKAFNRVAEALAKKEAQGSARDEAPQTDEPEHEEPPPLPVRLTDRARSVVDHARRMQVPEMEPVADSIDQAIQQRDQEHLEAEVDRLQAMVFDHAASGGNGGGEPEPESEAETAEDEPLEEVEDDLPF